ncbi:DNA N-6-adenine-methyltransferase [Paracoccus albus]|uniref:DNA N-6-adenine-methyltransferase n=1 Tax=Paracoccus albus TaxID=3017784 RepID=UPI0022EFF323|nr:DNA N-6-adenine-methyltransferase [Paracoccus albus]WBU61866.1 DNA N-6-adenine-methyltransferase [Paracoccus albus]
MIDGRQVLDRKVGHYAARIGKGFRQQRRMAKVSQEAVATFAGVSVGTIKAIEKGNGTLRTLLPALTAIGQKLIARHAPGDALVAGLITLRKRHGLSARGIATQLGLSRSTIAKMENGGDSRIATVADYAALVGAGLAIVPADHSPTFFASSVNASVFHGWHTPPDLFDAVENAVGAFDLDPCAPDDGGGHVRAAIKFCAAEDGLTREWRGKVFMNPPYGTVMRQWITKAQEEARDGSQVIGLVPARTDTLWWHNHIAGEADVVFLKGRLAFGDGKRAAPFPSALVLWNFCPNIATAIEAATGGHAVWYARRENTKKAG